ncbi:hypothetical protein TWF481_000610 [Arthrobotrys musiformis]|uniref:Mid2 domain-containing protein n=1 Tax=Arthrobotrys musiformis TaxID=47236 RepID=A0AAV9WP76_9PEZI
MGYLSFVVRIFLLHFLLFFNPIYAATLTLLSRDGSSTIQGWEGLSYQAIRYEPLCGNLGTADYYRQSYTYAPFCLPATEVFTNITDSFAIYDGTGIRLKGPDARIGAGTQICACFALRQIQDRNLAAAICIYVNGDAQAYFDNTIALNYRPGVDADRALPICGGGFDLEAARESWSKTAVQPDVTETVRTVGTIGTQAAPDPTVRGGTTVVSTEYIVSTYFPPAVPYTETITYTTTGPEGIATITTARTTEFPIATVTTASESNSKNDKVILGVGLGIGLPALILAIAGVVIGISALRRISRIAGRQASQEAGVPC